MLRVFSVDCTSGVAAWYIQGDTTPIFCFILSFFPVNDLRANATQSRIQEGARCPGAPHPRRRKSSRRNRSLLLLQLCKRSRSHVSVPRNWLADSTTLSFDDQVPLSPSIRLPSSGYVPIFPTSRSSCSRRILS